MALFIALRLWRFFVKNRGHNVTVGTIGQTTSQEEHVVYLDTDNILLPTIPPPPYSLEDPNPLTFRVRRRPVAVLAVVESIEAAEEGDNRDGDGGHGETRGTGLLRSNDSRRISVTLKQRRKDWELSLKAALSVMVFLLAIVGIAWLGSMTVAYLWPTNDEARLEPPSVRGTKEGMKVPCGVPAISIPNPSLTSSVSTSAHAPMSYPSSDLSPTLLALPSSELAKVREQLGDVPIFDCESTPEWLGRDRMTFEDMARTGRMHEEIRKWIWYDRKVDRWCMHEKIR